MSEPPDSERSQGPMANLPQPEPWLRQRSLWRCVEQMAAHHPILHPIGVELHLGTACNLACPECISRPTLDTVSFEPERALSVAAELVATGVKSVVLSGGGEPLLHAKAGEVMRVVHAGKVCLSLVTNGTLLHLHQESIVSCTSRIWVSVDAATASTHGRFRPQRVGGNAFAQLVSSLEAIAPKTRGRLTFSFLVITRPSGEAGELQSNVGEIAEAALLARSVGCTTFEVNLAFDKRLQPNVLHAAVAEPLADQLRRAMQLNRPDFRVFVGPMVAQVAAGRSVAQLRGKSYRRCPAAQIRALVSPRGVFLCPRHQDLPAARFGDPCTTSLAEIWGSVAFQTAFDSIDPRADCVGACMSMDLNEKLLAAIEWSREHGSPPDLTDDDELFM